MTHFKGLRPHLRVNHINLHFSGGRHFRQTTRMTNAVVTTCDNNLKLFRKSKIYTLEKLLYNIKIENLKLFTKITIIT